MSSHIRKLFDGFVQWAAEAFIGLLPLIAYGAFTHYAAFGSEITAVCPKTGLSAAGTYFGCTALPESPAQEICVLAIVISGLSALSPAQFMPGRHRPPRTTLTYFLTAVAILSLVVGAVFYGLISTHHYANLDRAAYGVLAAALLSSLGLALQEPVFKIQSTEGD